MVTIDKEKQASSKKAGFFLRFESLPEETKNDLIHLFGDCNKEFKMAIKTHKGKSAWLKLIELDKFLRKHKLPNVIELFLSSDDVHNPSSPRKTSHKNRIPVIPPEARKC